MNEYNFVGIKAMKDHSVLVSYLLKIYTYNFAFLLPLFLVLGIFRLNLSIFMSVLLTALTSSLSTIVINFVTDKLGNISKILYGGGRNTISKRDQLQGTLKAVKVMKMNKEFTKALDSVNNILEQDPEFYDAMLLKAQILIEGFDQPTDAKTYLRTIMMNTDKTESLYTWASSLHREKCHDVSKSLRFPPERV